MFERASYKRAAKAQLKGRRKIPVLTSLLIFILIGIIAGAVGLNGEAPNISAGMNSNGFTFSFFSQAAAEPILEALVSVLTIVFLLAQKYVFNIMYWDPRKIYFSDFVDGLNQWWQGVRGAIWYLLWVSLWTMLFVIPGIVKSYSYSMMFFIMAENPRIKVTRAMRLSKELTRGYKGDLFVMDLSFCLWFILSVLSCGIGFLWLSPYYQMSYTNVYYALKQFAIDGGRVTEQDFE